MMGLLEPRKKRRQRDTVVHQDWDDFNLTLDEAFEVEVKWGPYQVYKSLKWLGVKHPEDLDRLLDETEPGSRLFFALVLVNEHYQSAVAFAVDNRNKKIKHKVRSKVDRKMILPSILYNWPWPEDQTYAPPPPDDPPLEPSDG